jgi:AAA family ATP:ADP antiporter
MNRAAIPSPPRVRLLGRIADVRAGEGPAVALAAAYFFALLCGMYMLRPLREEMGIRGGVDRLDRAFLATFGAMLVVAPVASAVFARVPRGRAIPVVYGFFALNLVAFADLFARAADPRAHGALAWAPHAFFAWVSVYNLFVTSVFWSFMTDLFTSEQGRRLFGLISAGGSAGALAGPACTALLVRPLGVSGVALGSAALLAVAAGCAFALARRASQGAATMRRGEVGVGGGAFAGFTALARSPYLAALALHIVCITVSSTFLYFQQARIVAGALPSSAGRIQLFAAIDLGVNALSLALQALATGRILAGAGLAVGLALHPALALSGLLAIAAMPSLALVATVQALRRAVHYAIERPAREVLFTVVSREDRYKAKGLVDTVVYRGGDAASALAQGRLLAAGVGFAGSALIAAPFVLLWAAVALYLVRKHARLEQRSG